MFQFHKITFGQYQIIRHLSKDPDHTAKGDDLRYRADGDLAEGTYLAEDKAKNRQVILQLLPKLSDNSSYDWLEICQRADYATLLDHPNIARIYEIHEDPQARGHSFFRRFTKSNRSVNDPVQPSTVRTYIVKEYIVKPPATARLTIPEIAQVGLQIAEALAYAHEEFGLFHRDIQMGNIAILNGTDGRKKVKLLDFGFGREIAEEQLSKMYEMSEAALGFLMRHHSPERVLGTFVEDCRSDIF
jgi:serine/threonine protein kinase